MYTEHSPGQITSKFKEIEIISSLFSDQNAMRFEINYRKKKLKKKKANTWRLNNIATKYQRVTKEIKKEI